jgi:hypothetical protein
MPALSHVLLCAAMAVALWVILGSSLARLLAPEPALRWAIAPTLGWAVFSAAALPAMLASQFTRVAAAGMAVAALAAALFAIRRRSPAIDKIQAAAPLASWWGYGLAAALAVAPAMAILPKFRDGGVVLTPKMYDHSKIVIIDDILRLGLPPGNPFYGDAHAHLTYYYLWHFSAALLGRLAGANGWEADIALTWYTAFAASVLMMGLAVHISGRRAATLWVALLSVSLSLHPILSAVLRQPDLDRLLTSDAGLQGWIVQASWSPQHLAGAACLVVAILLMVRLAGRAGPVIVPALALTIAAGFESSTWVGGVAFAIAAPPVGLVLLLRAPPERRWRFVARAAAAALLVLIIVSPFLRDQYAATVARNAGAPVAFHHREVWGPILPEPLRRIMDLPAYWLLLLVIEFPAVYLLGSLALTRALIVPGGSPADKTLVVALGVVTLACLGISWLLISTIMNNDLGWRALLPALLILTAFAAAGMTRWLAWPLSFAGAAALVPLMLGLPDGLMFISDDATGLPEPSAAAFSRSSELWAAVRQYAGPDERIANNPLFLEDMVGSPINISWALLADRRSCYAGLNFVRAFVPLPPDRIESVDAMFQRVFDGTASLQELSALGSQYDCRLIVITPADAAWTDDAFATDPDYRLVDERPGRWRLYRWIGRAPARSGRN